MKTIKIGTFLSILLLLVYGFSFAVDVETVESYQLLDRLFNLTGPGAPQFLDDMVIFTAPSSYRRVGIAFADEGFAKVHWFRQLLIRRDPLEIAGKNISTHKDPGFVFYIHQIPENALNIEYRLIIDGLWTTDPGNPYSRRDKSTGLSLSVLSLPAREQVPGPLKGPPDSLSFNFNGPPGEIVSVAGNFNGWDPFMYELREGPAGTYTLNIPLPPGKYQYVFFHKGERYLDPFNPNRAYSVDGTAASEIVIR